MLRIAGLRSRARYMDVQADGIVDAVQSQVL